MKNFEGIYRNSCSLITMSFVLPVEIVIPAELQKLMAGARPAIFTSDQVQDILNFIEEYEGNDFARRVLDMPPYRCVFACRDTYHTAKAMFMNEDFTTGWAKLSPPHRSSFGPPAILEKLGELFKLLEH